MARDRRQQTAPASDEFEISLFGPGYGECLALHLGDGVWMVVDSCVDPRTKQAAALQYLNDIGVNASEAIKLLVLTHWHNDHIRGAAATFRAATSAEVFCSAALDKSEFFELVSASRREERIADHIPEFATIFDILLERNPGARAGTIGPEYVKAGERIYSANPSGHNCSVWVLSPSSATMNVAHLELARLLPKLKLPQPREVGVTPNRLAVALWVEFGNISVLLGSDLRRAEILRWAGRRSFFHDVVRPGEPTASRSLITDHLTRTTRRSGHTC